MPGISKGVRRIIAATGEAAEIAIKVASWPQHAPTAREQRPNASGAKLPGSGAPRLRGGEAGDFESFRGFRGSGIASLKHICPKLPA